MDRRRTVKYFFDMKKNDLQSYLRDTDLKVSRNTQSYDKHIIVNDNWRTAVTSTQDAFHQ